MNEYQARVARMYDDIDKLEPPPTMDAHTHFMAEGGEVGSSLLDNEFGQIKRYPRNNPARHKNPRANLILEMGQSLMMLCALANSVGLSLDDCFDRAIEKMYKTHGDDKE